MLTPSIAAAHQATGLAKPQTINGNKTSQKPQTEQKIKLQPKEPTCSLSPHLQTQRGFWMLLHPRSFTSVPLGGLHVPALSFHTSGRLSCLCPFTCTGGTQLVSVPAAGSGISGEHQSPCLLGRSHEQGPIQLHKVQFRLFEGQKHPTRISSQNPNLLLLLPLREMFSPIPVSSRVKPLKLPSLLPEVQVVQSQPAQLRDIPVALTLLKWLHPTHFPLPG